ncbi:MAG TPA: LuxR family transcriptional regulator [Methylocystis sp.]|nr:LuxR family transcriptional regulator [Methylocystis sp.]
MPVSESYCRMIEQIESFQASGNDNTQILKFVANSYGLTHVAYLGLQLPKLTRDGPLVCVTYPDNWVAHYRAQRYVRDDPTVHRSLQSILPTNWADFPQHAKRIRQLFGEAREFGIGSNGMTFPIRGRGGETALFSVVSDMPASDWEDFRRHNLPDMQMIAFYIHRLITEPMEQQSEPPKLSPRELECLKWAANGKTHEEIGVILNLSTKTVRVYLDTARHKLNGMNITHAVAKAIILNIIPAPL